MSVLIQLLNINRQLVLIKFSKKKSKTNKIVNFHGHIQNQHEIWIKMSTDKPSIGAVVLEIALDIWRKYLKTWNFFFLRSQRAKH
jgi:hypothetical protein